VDHSEAYEAAMQGRHGRQLALAQLDGVGKDDPPYDPFREMELAAQLQQQQENLLQEEGDMDKEMEEAELVNGERREGLEEEEESEIEQDVEEDDDDFLTLYRNDGSPRYKKSQLAAFRAGAPVGGLFAIVQVNDTQHKVTVDDVIVVNRLKPVGHYSIGSVHTLKDVYLVGSSHLTLVGMPIVAGAEVDVMVEEITRDAKLVVFKKRRRKNSQRKKGHRRDVTMLRVLDIRLPDAQRDHKHEPRVEIPVSK
jgi:large subunit ribosomal protein L21